MLPKRISVFLNLALFFPDFWFLRFAMRIFTMCWCMLEVFNFLYSFKVSQYKFALSLRAFLTAHFGTELFSNAGTIKNWQFLGMDQMYFAWRERWVFWNQGWKCYGLVLKCLCLSNLMYLRGDLYHWGSVLICGSVHCRVQSWPALRGCAHVRGVELEALSGRVYSCPRILPSFYFLVSWLLSLFFLAALAWVAIICPGFSTTLLFLPWNQFPIDWSNEPKFQVVRIYLGKWNWLRQWVSQIFYNNYHKAPRLCVVLDKLIESTTTNKWHIGVGFTMIELAFINLTFKNFLINTVVAYIYAVECDILINAYTIMLRLG